MPPVIGTGRRPSGGADCKLSRPALTSGDRVRAAAPGFRGLRHLSRAELLHQLPRQRARGRGRSRRWPLTRGPSLIKAKLEPPPDHRSADFAEPPWQGGEARTAKLRHLPYPGELPHVPCGAAGRRRGAARLGPGRVAARRSPDGGRPSHTGDDSRTAMHRPASPRRRAATPATPGPTVSTATGRAPRRGRATTRPASWLATPRRHTRARRRAASATTRTASAPTATRSPDWRPGARSEAGSTMRSRLPALPMARRRARAWKAASPATPSATA